MNRAERRRHEAAARKAGRALNPPEDPLAKYIGGYQEGYLEGYFRAIADLGARNTVALVAKDILAVHHDPIEQAKYVLSKAQKAMTPANLDAAALGIQQATTEHLQKKGLLPTFEDAQQAEEEAATVTDQEVRDRAAASGLVMPGA